MPNEHITSTFRRMKNGNRTYDHIKKAAIADIKPLRLRLMQYSILVLAGPESAWVTANSS